MAPSRTPEACDRRTRLLEAAVRLFSLHGYEDVGIRSIARAAGCTSAMIAFHFKGKRQLYRAAVAWTLAYVIRLTSDFPPLPDPQDPDAPARAEAALRAAHRRVLGVVRGGESSPGLEPHLVGLFLRELGHPEPGRHGAAHEAVQPLLVYLARALRLARPGCRDGEIQAEMAARVGEALFRLTYPEFHHALHPPPGPGEPGT